MRCPSRSGPSKACQYGRYIFTSGQSAFFGSRLTVDVGPIGKSHLALDSAETGRGVVKLRHNIWADGGRDM